MAAPPAGPTGTVTTPPLAKPPASMPRPDKPRWWRRPWVAPFAVVAFAFVAFSLPPYLSLDPDRSRVPDPGLPLYFPLLVAHVTFGAVALLTCGLQVWPWFRQRHPAAHRRSGLVYIFAGVLPAGAIGLVIGAVSPFGPVARVSNVLLAALWLATTLTGFRMARHRRYVDHRRWMIRSFALTASIITNRVWGALAAITLWPQLDTTFHNDETLLTYTIAGISTWTGWTTTLLLAEWWLERDNSSKRRTHLRGARQHRTTAAKTPAA